MQARSHRAVEDKDFYEHPGDRIAYFDKGFTYKTDGLKRGQIGIKKAAGASLIGFHDIRLVDRMNGAISSGYFAEWLEAGGDEPAFDQCVNQKIPYFLGGCADEVDDLELSDLDVYWHLSSQLICWARTVPKDKWENGVITVPVNITID